MLGLYRLITRIAEPLGASVLRARAKRGKEDAARLGERLGHAGMSRPPGPLVWLHGVSVGESLSLLCLIEALRAARPDLAILVTSGTVTAAQMLQRRLPAGVLHQYIPIDTPGAVGRFLDHWRPALGVLVESELWPNLLLTAKARGVRLALISARMTEASAKGWARRPKASAELLSSFDLILAQDQEAAGRLRGLGARVYGLANLKLPGRPLPVDEAQLTAMKTEVGKRPVLLAASTHPGEDEIILAAAPPGALTILVPRHPVRGPELSGKLNGAPLRSKGEAPSPEHPVYIADTLGELGLFFRLADLVVLGGSFLPNIGGHNPLEPARLGKAPLHGPHIGNWTSVYADLGGAAVRCETPEALGAAIAGLLNDPNERARRGVLALKAAQGQDQVLDDLLVQLSPLLPA